jgi:hypothetical protein
VEKFVYDFLGQQPAAVVAFVAVLGLLVMVGKALNKFTKWVTGEALPLVRRLTHLADDFLGTEARDGKEAQPGVIARLAAHDDQLKAIKYEVQYNSGGSLKDAVKRVADRLENVEKQVTGQQPTVNVSVAASS